MFSSVDLQHLELRRFQVSEIARAFRVPPHMLADLERTTHNNAEEMGSQFLQLSLLPHIVNWEQCLRRALLSPAERQRYVIEFLTDGIARAALAQRYEAFGKASRLDDCERSQGAGKPAADRWRGRTYEAAQYGAIGCRGAGQCRCRRRLAVNRTTLLCPAA
jgi:phage portal protein BeeE